MMFSEILERIRRTTEAERREISGATKIPKPTLDKLRYGVTSNPRIATAERLGDYFDQLDRTHARHSARAA